MRNWPLISWFTNWGKPTTTQLAEKEGTHRHKCAFCGWVWEHPDSFDLDHGSQGHHECRRCKRCNWGLGIYTGDDPVVPMVVREPCTRLPAGWKCNRKTGHEGPCAAVQVEAG